MSQKVRQEVLNVLLSQLLSERGAVVLPETIRYTGIQRDRHMPDVIVSYQGLRTAIEGEIQAPKARDKAIDSAKRRVENGIAHIGVGVVYPASLPMTNDITQLKGELARAKLEIAVTTEAYTTGYETGDVDYLERILRSTFEQLVKEDVVNEAVALLDIAVDQFAGVVLSYRGIWGRITQELGRAATDKELDALTERQRAANCRIGGLVLINAMIFHDILSSHYTKITPLALILAQKRFDAFSDQWNYILENINYYSIFHLARQVLLTLAGSAIDMPETISQMVETAKQISEMRAALRHDLMGRIYHRLLSDAKYLGTYYTSLPAAAMLLKLALRPEGWDKTWDDVQSVGQLRIADLACGTGTLLMAAADVIVDNYVSAAASKSKPVDLIELHKQITQEIINGYDVLPSAIHLTASTLAMRSPNVQVDRMHLYSLPLGGVGNKLGTLEFLNDISIATYDMFGALSDTSTPQQVTGKGIQQRYINLPDLDLCVMNPPFVRSVGGNLLFGSFPADERGEMQTKLKKLAKKVSANVTSGLGSVFVGLGNRQIKVNGRLALVLPKALLSGVSWGDTRQLINDNYVLDYVIVSHDAERWNFSDSTDLSEVLLVATKFSNRAVEMRGHKAKVVNLWRNPTKSLEALAIVSQILQATPPDLVDGQGATQITLNGEKAGEIITMSWGEMREDWFLPCAFAQSDLTRSAYYLLKGNLWIPGKRDRIAIPLCQLGNLGKLGPDRRDIHDGFEAVESQTAYASFWGHDASSIFTIAQKANKYLSPLPKAKPGRNLRKAADLWPLSGRILLAERMRLNTQKLVAVYVDEPVLSNVWWSFAFNELTMRQQLEEKALAIWLNSTLAILMLLVTRDETEGAWVDFKKPSLTAMPVLDVRALSSEQIAILASAYDRVAALELKPLSQMASDEVRKQIDNAIAEALKLPDFSILRTMLGREPVVCMERI